LSVSVAFFPTSFCSFSALRFVNYKSYEKLSISLMADFEFGHVWWWCYRPTVSQKSAQNLACTIFSGRGIETIEDPV